LPSSKPRPARLPQSSRTTAAKKGEEEEAAMSWRWRLETSDGSIVDIGGEIPEFSAQGDAETWLGEIWRELADSGVEQVTLLDDDHVVYGPMSLSME
jgi:hypothetical protein